MASRCRNQGAPFPQQKCGFHHDGWCENIVEAFGAVKDLDSDEMAAVVGAWVQLRHQDEVERMTEREMVIRHLEARVTNWREIGEPSTIEYVTTSYLADILRLLRDESYPVTPTQLRYLADAVLHQWPLDPVAQYVKEQVKS